MRVRIGRMSRGDSEGRSGSMREEETIDRER
jgi:hypothetical protein